MNEALLRAVLSILLSDGNPESLSPKIDALVWASERSGVPVTVLTAYCWETTHLGGNGFGSVCGGPRTDTESAVSAGLSLAESLSVCGTMVGAVSRVVSGSCVSARREANHILRLSSRIARSLVRFGVTGC